ncbi:MAG: hypothetical protein PUD38_02620 [Firmicutes bacterium]|nr:hypothetical protein [Bacillota bacterium]
MLKGEMPLEYIAYKVIGIRSVPNLKIAGLFKKLFSDDRTKHIGHMVQIEIPTNDGFDQATHPDAVWFHNNLYMVVTPYAYDDERLENPCLYICDDKEELHFREIGDNPLVKWEKHRGRHYHSDPALLADDSRLTVFYRESMEVNHIRTDRLYKMESEDAIVWTAPEEIKLPTGHFIAPSFCREENCISVFYTEDVDEQTVFHLGSMTGNEITPIAKPVVFNAPHDMKIWHVDVKKYASDAYVGLFTYMEKTGRKSTALYYATSKDMLNWTIQREIPKKNKDDSFSVYKATSLKTGGEIIVIASVKDKRCRWRIYNMGALE